MSAVDLILERLDGAKQSGDTWSARCPAHEDRNPSLTVSSRSQGDPGAVVHCHAGCTPEAVVGALGLTVADLFDPKSTGRRREVAAYQYHDAEGTLIHEVVRYDPKGFSQRRPDGRGGWINSLKGVDRVLYRLPAVLEAVANGQAVYVCEGEKDADALAATGRCATTAPQGAGSFHHAAANARQVLAGAAVIVVHDQDAKGIEHAHQVAETLRDVAAVTVARPVGRFNDVADHLAAGHTPDEFVVVASDTVRPDGSVTLDEWLSGDANESPADVDQVDGDELTPPQVIRSRLLRLDAVLPDPRPLIDGYLDLGTIGLLYARWGCYKTFLAIDWGLHVVNGRPWLGHDVEPGLVVVLGYEAPVSIHRRAQAWDRYHQAHTDPGSFLLDRTPPRLSDLGAMAAYREVLDELDARLVIVDTVARGGAGLDMNGPDADLAFLGLHTLAGDDRVVLGIGHAGKDASRGVRGSSSQEDQVDFIFRLDRDRSKSGQPQGPATLSNPKQKDREYAPNAMFDLSDGITRISALPGDRVLLPLGAADADEAPANPEDVVDAKAETLIVAFLRSCPPTRWVPRSEVRRACKRSESRGGPSVAKVDEILERLVELEAVNESTDGVRLSDQRRSEHDV